MQQRVTVINQYGVCYNAILLAKGVSQSLIVPYMHRMASPCCIYVPNSMVMDYFLIGE